ncbi:hypothetical protein BU16DRAFT_541195 [Lophium mytilinum]|uniref:DUF7730 domain-containing protein n=1 Tax=Lophium mytilinum TaxID=390894 RepID=A0A6A6QN08_9PEZI|nr:hypothetical protein BU16DRAFT_541195 [Lophium mytilinum]
MKAFIKAMRALPRGRAVHDRLLKPAASPQHCDIERQVLKAKNDELESVLEVIKSDIKALQRKHDALDDDYTKLIFKHTASKAVRDHLKVSKEHLERELGAAKDYIKTLQSIYDALDAEYTKVKTQLEISNAKIETLNSTLSAKNGQIQYLIGQYDRQYVSAAEKFLAEKGFVQGALQGLQSRFSPGQVLLDAHINRMSAFRLMKLPGELRNRIYEFALVLGHPVDLWPINGFALGLSNLVSKPPIKSRDEILQKDLANINIALLRVSKQVYKETVGMLYGHNTFQFSGHEAFVPMTAFLRHIGSGCNFITSISIECPRDSFQTVNRSWKLDEDKNEFMQEKESALDAFYRRLRVSGYYSVIGHPHESFVVGEGERILGRLPALRSFTMLVPHAMAIRSSSYLVRENVNRRVDMLRWEADAQTKQFAAATAAGTQVEKSVVFIRRHETQPKIYKDVWDKVTDLDDEKQMGWEDFKKVKEHYGWKIEHASYTMQPDGPAFIVDKPKPLRVEQAHQVESDKDDEPFPLDYVA